MATLSALSFWQPYAWLIVNGHADVDSRGWAPTASRIGEKFAVHASKRRVSTAEYLDFVKMMKDLRVTKYPASPDEFEYGAVIGTVKLVDVVKNSKSYFAHRGFFHWKLTGARTLKPIPCIGRRSWFTIDIG